MRKHCHAWPASVSCRDNRAGCSFRMHSLMLRAPKEASRSVDSLSTLRQQVHLYCADTLCSAETQLAARRNAAQAGANRSSSTEFTATLDTTAHYISPPALNAENSPAAGDPTVCPCGAAAARDAQPVKTAGRGQNFSFCGRGPGSPPLLGVPGEFAGGEIDPAGWSGHNPRLIFGFAIRRGHQAYPVLHG